MNLADFNRRAADDDDGARNPNLSNTDVKRLYEEYKIAYTHGFKIRDKYNGKEKDMTPNEHAEFDRAMDAVDNAQKALQNAERWASATEFANLSSNALPMGGPSPNAKGDGPGAVKSYNNAHMKAYREYLRGAAAGMGELKTHPAVKKYSGMETNIPEDDEMAEVPLNQYLKAAWFKAYQADNPAGFGFAVPPQELIQTFITLLKKRVFIRAMATKYQIPRAESLGVPAIDTDPADFTWTNELNVGAEETTVATGKREFRPSPLAKYIKESKKLLRQVPAVENVIMDRLTYIVGTTQEKAFLTGSGADQPLGVFTATTAGIDTSRDTTAAGTGSTTAIASDDIVNTFYALQEHYRANASWIMHRSVVKAVRLFKDTTNNYIWTAGYGLLNGLGPGGGLQETPDRLMGRPISESEFAPSTFTTGLYLAIIGDWSYYWIADALDVQIQVLYELFALNNQMGYIMRLECDGMPVLAEAFSRLKLA